MMIPKRFLPGQIRPVASEGMLAALKQKNHHPGLGWWVRIIASFKLCRRDYPLHLAFGQAQQANFHLQIEIAQASAGWLTARMTFRLPEGQNRRKPKLESVGASSVRPAAEHLQ
jgi:hypothetical protein